MKSLLILVCMAVFASPCSSDSIVPPLNGLAADGSFTEVGPASNPQRAHDKQALLRAQGSLLGLRGAVVKEMRATKAFVKAAVVKEEGTDRGLMLLVAIGMIVLQLRRKHKSLPQRQIAPYS